jgi:hypothetical protein
MRRLHGAVLKALLACHLFDPEGRLLPFTFSDEIAHRTARRAYLNFWANNTSAPDRRDSQELDWEKLDYPLDGVLAGPSNSPEWPYSRLGDLDGGHAGFLGIPDRVVRTAWAKASPWMHTPLPEWWAFKVCHFRPSPTRLSLSLSARSSDCCDGVGRIAVLSSRVATAVVAVYS